MKRLLIASALALAAITAGCSGCAVLDPNKGALTETLLDEKALYGAEAMLFGANTAADAAVDAGLLKTGSTQAVQVADALDAAHKALLAARGAYAVGDAKGYSEKLASIQKFVSTAWAIIPGKKEA